LNRGIPFVTSTPTSKLSLAIEDITNMLQDGDRVKQAQPKTKEGLFKKKK
jgi:MinD-like ATPase involved in chromosome partitioning or flagellar assembly